MRKYLKAGRRLACFDSSSTANYWDDRWQAARWNAAYAIAEKGRLSNYYKGAFLKHLPREGQILEGGCGIGDVVLALRARGYDAEGVDWAADTVRRIKDMRPELPVRVGDVTSLDVPDQTYAGYVSLGVMEHFREGPGVALLEARRVLKQGGVLLVAVPAINAINRTAVKNSLAGSEKGFYQYAFSREEFAEELERNGFRIDAIYSYDPITTLRDHWPRLAKILGAPGAGHVLVYLTCLVSPLARAMCHMMLFAAVRN